MEEVKKIAKINLIILFFYSIIIIFGLRLSSGNSHDTQFTVYGVGNSTANVY